MNAQTKAIFDRAVARLSLLKYFPSDKEAKSEVAALLASICHNDSEVMWLTNRMVALFDEWPGPHEVRAVACSKFKPRDGLEVFSSAYSEGVPSERPEPQYSPIGAGEARKLLVDAAKLLPSKGIPNGANLPPKPRFALPPIPAGKRITRADIEREQQRLREKRANEEL